MIYGGDKVAELPFIDINNTLLMAMQLNAAKDMYEKGLKLLEDFNKLYGDFYSPFTNDLVWYDQNVTGKVRDTLDWLYTNGIDPLRSAEGRLIVQRLISSMDTGTINTMKANAKRGEAFLENVARLKEKGLFNADMDKYLYGDYNDFSTVSGGRVHTFDRLSADPYYNVDQLLNPIFSNVKPIYDEATTRAKKDGMLHNTVTEERLMLALNDSRADILATPSGKYLMHLAQLEADQRNLRGINATAQDVFTEWAKNRMSDYIRDDVQSDPVYMANLNARNSLNNQIAAMREQDRITRAQWADPNNPAVIRANNGGRGNRNKEGLNYPVAIKNAALRKLAGVTSGNDALIPATLARGSYYALMTFGLKHNMIDAAGKEFTRSFTHDEALEFLQEMAQSENPNMFKYYIGSDRKPIDSNKQGSVYRVTKNDLTKLQSPEQYVSGFYGNKYKSKSDQLDENTTYVMQYTGNHNVRYTNRATVDEGLLVILYPLELDGDKSKINFNNPIYKTYKLPIESRLGSRNALTYNDSSQAYVSAIATEIGKKEFGESSTLDDSDNISFEGNPFQ